MGSSNGLLICPLKGISRHIDGDSFEAIIVCEGYKEVTHSIRIKGIDCPEIFGKCKHEKRMARKAASFTKKTLLNAELVQVEIFELDFYKRILARVICDGVDLGQLLIDKGLARKYEGSKKSWCN